jgi:hypothetical protein
MKFLLLPKNTQTTLLRRYYVEMAFSKACTSPPALLTARTAASLSLLRLSLASCSRLALVFELPLGATSLNNLALSAAVRLTKFISRPALGVLGVRGILETPEALGLPMLFRREERVGDIWRVDRVVSVGEIEADRSGDALFRLRGVVKGDVGENA